MLLWLLIMLRTFEHPGPSFLSCTCLHDEYPALRAALIRARRLLDTYESMVEDEEMLAEMRGAWPEWDL